MLSFPIFPTPQRFLFQQPFLHDIQPPKTSKRPKKLLKTTTRSTTNNHSSYHLKNFSYSASKESSFSTHLPPSCNYVSSEVNPDANDASCSEQQWVDSDLLEFLVEWRHGGIDVRKIHAVALKCVEDSSITFVCNNLISAYVKNGNLAEARRLFDEMPERNVVSWTAMLNGYVRFGLDEDALRFLGEFFNMGIRGNSRTFVCVMNLCRRRLDFDLGRQIHGFVVKGNHSNLIVNSALLHFYAQCGDLSTAFSVFDHMTEQDVVSWTTMITACSQHGWGEEAFALFTQMLSDGFFPNEFTVCSVLKACGEELELRFGRQLHGAIVKKVYRNDVFLGTALVDMYAKCGPIEDSRTVFDDMRRRNTVTWTSIIAGYARNELGEEAISLFRRMKRLKIYANNLTMVSILRACGMMGTLPAGKEVHAQLIKNCTHSNIYIGSTLVWLYCKCGEYSIASKVLQGMSSRDVVSWTAMISGCAHIGHENEALGFLKEMLGEGMEPNPFTYSSALKACARLEDIQQGKLIHSSISKSPALSNVFVGSALINMYAKCGYLSEATQVFDSMPERNLVSWKAMIVAYAKNGRCGEALKLMYRMQAEGIEVDDYIHAIVFTACGDSEWTVESSSDLCSYTY